jgi:hypothetical protein
LSSIAWMAAIFWLSIWMFAWLGLTRLFPIRFVEADGLVVGFVSRPRTTLDRNGSTKCEGLTLLSSWRGGEFGLVPHSVLLVRHVAVELVSWLLDRFCLGGGG